MGEAIAATTSSTPRPARAQEIVNRNDFEEMLRRAESDPKGAEARALVSEVIKFIVLGGNKVPWGQAERAHEITRFLALYRYAGASNFFNTANPDDVHSPYAAQLCYPARELQKDDPKLHKKISDDLKFKKKSLDERMRVEQRYQQLAANNPVASALNFDFVLRNYMENLLGLHLDAKGVFRNNPPDKSLRELPKGLCGRLHAGLFVKETNKRGCLHGHGTTKGGLTPALLAHCCDDPDLARACVRAIESQVSASLPVEYHAVAVAQDVLNVAKRKDTGVPIPDFGEKFPHDDHVTCLEHHGMRDPASTLEALSIRIASMVWRVFWHVIDATRSTTHR